MHEWILTKLSVRIIINESDKKMYLCLMKFVWILSIYCLIGQIGFSNWRQHNTLCYEWRYSLLMYFFRHLIFFFSSLPYSTLQTNGFVLIKQEIYLLLKNKGWMCGFCEGRKILQNDVVVVDTAKSTFWLHMDLVAIFIFCWVSLWISIILKNTIWLYWGTNIFKLF